jgi:hypothetical protein
MYTPIEDAYVFTRFHWLVKLLKKLKIIKNKQVARTQYNYTEIKLDTIVRMVYTQMNLLDRKGYTPAYILTGLEALDLAITEINSIASFTIPKNLKTVQYRLAGLEVHLIPWMKGIIVVPEFKD